MAQVYDPITRSYKDDTSITPKSVSFGTDSIADLKKWSTQPTNVSSTNVSATNVSTPVVPKSTTKYTGLDVAKTTDQSNKWLVATDTFSQLDKSASNWWITPKSELPTVDSLVTGWEVTTEQKLQYEKEAMQNDQLNKDLLWASKTVEQAQAEKDYQNKQEQNRVQREWLQVQNAEIASSQRIQQAGKQLDNLRQNIAYIGNMWRPAKSMVQLDAMKNQVSTAEQTFRELVQVEDNLKTIQKLWVEYNAQAFEKQMSDLQDQLDTQVSTALQWVITDFNKEAQGIDTMDELNALREKRLDTADTSLEAITNRNFIDRQNRIEQFQQIIADKKTSIQNSNTLNKDMSTALWYYVNGNGEAIISASTGKPIPTPVEAPMEPVFDMKSGKLISFATWPDWQIVTTVDQVIDQPQFSAQVIQSMITAVQRGTMTTAQALEVLPPDAQQQFLWQVWSIQQQPKEVTPEWKQDESGNWYNANSSTSPSIQTGTWWATWDLRWLASQYPWQAWAKNNNPWWMTWWVSQWLKDAWTTAWIDFWQWTPRPAWEGNSYISFNTIEDWLAAQWIALSRNGWDVNARLQKRVWTGEWPSYAKQVMWWAWLPNGTKFEDLTDEQAQALQMAVIKKESSWLYKLMTQAPQGQWWEQTFDPNKAPDYINYIEKWKLPTWMKSWTKAYNDFISQAWEWYIDSKSKELSQKWFTISNPEAFKNIDAKTLESVNKAISQVPAFEQAMNELITLVWERWTELPFTSWGKEINQKIKNAQLIAKEIYNLWVLNWPDLALMESIIANPAGNYSKLWWAFVDYKDLLEKGKQTILSNAYAQASNIWLEPIDKNVKNQSTTPSLLANPVVKSWNQSNADYLKSLWITS